MRDFVQMAAWAVERLARAQRPWAAVSGPATATVASMARLGWRFRDGITFITQRGVEVSLKRDAPARVAALVKEAVIEWRWKRLERRVPGIRPPEGAPSLGPCWRPLIRLLDPAIKVPGWTSELRGALRSAVANRQWPQLRKFQAGLVSNPHCQLCLAVGAARCSEMTHASYCSGWDGADNPPAGSLVHRVIQCPCLHSQRSSLAPAEVRRCHGSLASSTGSPD